MKNEDNNSGSPLRRKGSTTGDWDSHKSRTPRTKMKIMNNINMIFGNKVFKLEQSEYPSSTLSTSPTSSQEKSQADSPGSANTPLPTSLATAFDIAAVDTRVVATAAAAAAAADLAQQGEDSQRDNMEYEQGSADSNVICSQQHDSSNEYSAIVYRADRSNNNNNSDSSSSSSSSSNNNNSDKNPRVSRAALLYSTCCDGNIDQVRQILEDELKSNDSSDNTHSISESERASIIARLVNSRHPKDKSTPLHACAAKNNIEIMKLLLENGAEIEIKDQLESTPLFWAAAHGSVEAVDLLLCWGAQINIRDKYGKTPLHLALTKNYLLVAEKLVLFGGEINFKLPDGSTCLHSVVSSKTCDEGVLMFLLKHNAIMSSKDHSGLTPLLRAAAANNADAVTIMLEWETQQQNQAAAIAAAAATKMSRRGGSAAALIGNNGLLSGLLGSSQQHSSASGKRNCARTSKYLNATDNNGRNIFHIIAEYGSCDVARAITNQGFQPALIYKLVNEKEPVQGYTPLMLSVVHQHEKMTHMLLSLGSDVNQQDNKGDTAVHLCVMRMSSYVEFERNQRALQANNTTAASPYNNNNNSAISQSQVFTTHQPSRAGDEVLTRILSLLLLYCPNLRIKNTKKISSKQAMKIVGLNKHGKASSSSSSSSSRSAFSSIAEGDMLVVSGDNVQ